MSPNFRQMSLRGKQWPSNMAPMMGVSALKVLSSRTPSPLKIKLVCGLQLHDLPNRFVPEQLKQNGHILSLGDELIMRGTLKYLFAVETVEPITRADGIKV